MGGNMRKKTFVLFIFIFFSVLVFFSKDRLAILDFKSQDFNQNKINFITETLTTEISDKEIYEVIERTQLDRVYKELNFSSQDDFDDSQILEIGKLSKANYILVGAIDKLGDMLIINARVVETETGKILKGKNIKLKERDLFEGLLELSKYICEKDIIINNNKKFVSEDEKKYDLYRNLSIGLLITGSLSITTGLALTGLGIGYLINYHNINKEYYAPDADMFYTISELEKMYVNMSNSSTIASVGFSIGLSLFTIGLVLDLVTIYTFRKMSDHKVGLFIENGKILSFGLEISF